MPRDSFPRKGQQRPWRYRRRFFFGALGSRNFADGRVSAFRNFRMSASACRFSSAVFETVQSEGIDQVEIAHVRVVRGKQDAEIAGDPDENEFFRTEIVQQSFERGRKEAGMFRLENEVIILLGPQQQNDLVAARFFPLAMQNLPPEIRTPAPEIIVHVNHRDAHFLRPLFQPHKLPRHRPGISQELVRLRKIEVVDDVDKQQRDLRFIRSAPVKIWISGRH